MGRQVSHFDCILAALQRALERGFFVRLLHERVDGTRVLQHLTAALTGALLFTCIIVRDTRFANCGLTVGALYWVEWQ